jgi:hypothetical protein
MGHIGYDSCRSQRELPEYTKIDPHCPEKSATFMGSKIVFILHQKGTQVNANRVRKTSRAIRNHYLMTLHYHPFVKNGGSKNSLFHFFDILRV